MTGEHTTSPIACADDIRDDQEIDWIAVPLREQRPSWEFAW